jgi:hypothetical protein
MSKITSIKRRQGLVLLSLLFDLGLIMGCTGASKPRIPPAKFEVPPLLIHTDQRIIPLYPNKEEESPRMTLSIEVSDASGSLGQLIQELLYDGLSSQEYTERITALYTDQYLATLSIPIPLDEYDSPPSETLNWEYTETLEASSPYSQLLVLSRNLEFYLGGAHGMKEKRYFVIFHNTDTVQHLRLEDLIKPDAWSGLEGLIVEALRKKANLETDAPLSQGGFFEDAVEVPDNFFLTPQGLGFHWDPYEIAPYVMGSIEVVLPYKQIQDMLKSGTPIHL